MSGPLSPFHFSKPCYLDATFAKQHAVKDFSIWNLGLATTKIRQIYANAKVPTFLFHGFPSFVLFHSFINPPKIPCSRIKQHQCVRTETINFVGPNPVQHNAFLNKSCMIIQLSRNYPTNCLRDQFPQEILRGRPAPCEGTPPFQKLSQEVLAWM